MDNTTSVTPAMHATALGFGLFVMLVVVVMYFVPTIVAALRKHRQLPAIALVNMLLGWTVLGWIASMVWALVSPTPPQVIVMQQPPAPPTP